MADGTEAVQHQASERPAGSCHHKSVPATLAAIEACGQMLLRVLVLRAAFSPTSFLFKIMKTSSLLALVSFSVVPLFAADAPPADVVFFDHAKVDNAFATGMPLLVNTRFKVQTGRRVVPGQVEVHASDTDIFYVTEGSATLTTGGKVVDPKTTGV